MAAVRALLPLAQSLKKGGGCIGSNVELGAGRIPGQPRRGGWTDLAESGRTLPEAAKNVIWCSAMPSPADRLASPFDGLANLFCLQSGIQTMTRIQGKVYNSAGPRVQHNGIQTITRMVCANWAGAEAIQMMYDSLIDSCADSGQLAQGTEDENEPSQHSKRHSLNVMDRRRRIQRETVTAEIKGFSKLGWTWHMRTAVRLRWRLPVPPVADGGSLVAADSPGNWQRRLSSSGSLRSSAIQHQFGSRVIPVIRELFSSSQMYSDGIMLSHGQVKFTWASFPEIARSICSDNVQNQTKFEILYCRIM
ncbi:hypothetical protein B0H13DRAFT_1895452 [Mycena leptocephala]|nr:hypothetical protein B0H13DRAFT_1895452 [Mycena leptocephala]